MVNQPGPNWEYNRKRRHLAKGNRRLPELLALSNYQCHWCQRDLVLRRSLPIESIVTAKSDWVIWRDVNGIQHKSYWATTDHVKPRRNGGGNELENLVASCPNCNRTRTKQSSETEQSKWRNNPICKCGKSKPLPAKRCADCVAQNNVFRAYCKITYASMAPGDCRRCGTLMELIGNVNIGPVYGCPACKLKRAISSSG